MQNELRTISLSAILLLPTVLGSGHRRERGMATLPVPTLICGRRYYYFPIRQRVAAQVYYDTERLAVESGYPCEAVTTLRDFVAYDVQQRKTQQLASYPYERPAIPRSMSRPIRRRACYPALRHIKSGNQCTK
jgi:hypothetical protein